MWHIGDKECGGSFEEEKNISSAKKWIAIGTACIALVLALIITLTSIFSGSAGSYALYLKGNEMYFTMTSEVEPKRVTKELVGDSEDDYGLSTWRAYFASDYTKLSKDGEKLFYCSNFGNYGGFSLNYRFVDKSDKSPVEIDTGVSDYAIDENGEVVIYRLEENDDKEDEDEEDEEYVSYGGSLYRYSLKEEESEKIDSKVIDYRVTLDGKEIIYLTNDGNLYFKNGDKDKDKLARKVTSLVYVSDDLGIIYYEKEGALYLKSEKEDKKIASNYSSLVQVYESGELYYLKKSSVDITLSSFVEDDKKEADAAMKEPEYPEYPDYPFSWEYPSTKAYNAAVKKYNKAVKAYNKAKEKYWDDRDKWRDKKSRDEIRELLTETTVADNVYTLCYYDGKKETVISENCVDSGYDIARASKTPVAGYTQYDFSNLKKIKFSEIGSSYMSIDEIKEKLGADALATAKEYIAIKGVAKEVEGNTVRDLRIASDGKTAYFLEGDKETSTETKAEIDTVDITETDADENEDGNKEEKKEPCKLYKLEISGTKMEKPELYAEEVLSDQPWLVNNDKVMYVTENGLFMNKEKVDDSSEIGQLRYSSKTNALVFMSDLDVEEGYGTLKIYKNGKTSEISDDVHDYSVKEDGAILYLYDYREKQNEGVLYIYKDHEIKK